MKKKIFFISYKFYSFFLSLFLKNFSKIKIKKKNMFLKKKNEFLIFYLIFFLKRKIEQLIYY
jgi:hypothetical protein